MVTVWGAGVVPVPPPVPPPVLPPLDFSVHLILHTAPEELFFLSEVKATVMSPAEVTLGFLVLQYAFDFPLAVTVTLSPFLQVFLSLLLVLNLVQTKDILAQVSPIL